MKQITYVYSILVTVLLLFSACNSNTISDNKIAPKTKSKNFNEFASVVNFMEKNVDFINSKPAPTLIDAKEVNDNLGNYLVIDIRGNKDYIAGHIDGAQNISLGNLLNFMDNKVSTVNFKKIVLVCKTGQTAAYGTAILRFLGHRNVYSMKYGMTAWNPKFRQWHDAIGNKFSKKISYEATPMDQPNQFPVLNTGEMEVYEIIHKRAQVLLDEGFNDVLIKVDKVMENPEAAYIINYWGEEHYNMGHLPGAVQYTPKKTLKINSKLKTIPSDKPVVVYCHTGQHSAFVVAYLRLLGYHAKSMAFGANSFMNKKMVEDPNLGNGFSNKMINNFQLITGKYPSN